MKSCILALVIFIYMLIDRGHASLVQNHYNKNGVYTECGGFVMPPEYPANTILEYKLNETYNQNEKCLWVFQTQWATIDFTVRVDVAGFNNTTADGLTIYYHDNNGTHTMKIPPEKFGFTLRFPIAVLDYLLFSSSSPTPGTGFRVTLGSLYAIDDLDAFYRFDESTLVFSYPQTCGVPYVGSGHIMGLFQPSDPSHNTTWFLSYLDSDSGDTLSITIFFPYHEDKPMLVHRYDGMYMDGVEETITTGTNPILVEFYFSYSKGWGFQFQQINSTNSELNLNCHQIESQSDGLSKSLIQKESDDEIVAQQLEPSSYCSWSPIIRECGGLVPTYFGSTVIEYKVDTTYEPNEQCVWTLNLNMWLLVGGGDSTSIYIDQQDFDEGDGLILYYSEGSKLKGIKILPTDTGTTLTKDTGVSFLYFSSSNSLAPKKGKGFRVIVTPPHQHSDSYQDYVMMDIWENSGVYTYPPTWNDTFLYEEYRSIVLQAESGMEEVTKELSVDYLNLKYARVNVCLLMNYTSDNLEISCETLIGSYPNGTENSYVSNEPIIVTFSSDYHNGTPGQGFTLSWTTHYGR